MKNNILFIITFLVIFINNVNLVYAENEKITTANCRKELPSDIELSHCPEEKTPKYLKDGWHFWIPNDEKLEYTWTDNLVYTMYYNDAVYYKNGAELMRKGGLVCAHGGWTEAPFNSLASIEKTLDNEFNCVEIDIRFTKDDVPVLFHDATLERWARKKDNNITNISEAEMNELANTHISTLTLKELRDNYRFSINLDDNNQDPYEVIEEYKNNNITTLEEALNYAKDKKLVYLIELKEGTKEQIASVVALTKKYGLNNAVIYLSVCPDLLIYVRNSNCNEYLQLIDGGQSIEAQQNIYNLLKTATNRVYVPGHGIITDYSGKAFGTPVENLPSRIEDARALEGNFKRNLKESFVKFNVNNYFKDDDEKVIARIPAGTTKNTIDINTTGVITIKDKNDIIINDKNSKLSTGNKIYAHFEYNEVDSNIENDTYYYDLNYDISVLGDVNGDGYADKVDAKKIAKHIIDKDIISGDAYLMAADYNNDQIIKMNDLIKMIKSNN